jgi:transposase
MLTTVRFIFHDPNIKIWGNWITLDIKLEDRLYTFGQHYYRFSYTTNDTFYYLEYEVDFKNPKDKQKLIKEFEIAQIIA